MSLPNRTDTLLWTGMRPVGIGYEVVCERFGQPVVLGLVWKESPAKHALWRAQRTGEPALAYRFKSRRDAATTVARIEEPRSGDAGPA